MTDDQDSVPPWLEGISGPYLPALILSEAPVIRVVAGPGSGKTTGLKKRVQRLIQRDGVDPAEIFVGTFTRAIAADLQKELGAEIKVQTLHAHAYELLRENVAALGGLRLRFLLSYEEEAMLYDVAPSVPALKTHNIRKAALRRQQSARSERSALPDATFSGEIDRWLRFHGGMLIGEVVWLAVQGLESEDIPRGRFHEVIVDEYQDLTAAEQDLVELIWSRRGSLVVLGDNDQSIYHFRFNHPLGIDEFSQRWQEHGLEDLAIPENRRCGEEIVGVANMMMAEAGSAKQPMIPMSGRPGSVALLQWADVDAEVAGLSEHMRRHQSESFLVLVPRRFIGYRLKDAVGADAQTAFHQEVLEHQLAQEAFAAASLLANPNDLVAVRAWLGFVAGAPRQASRRNAAAYESVRGRTGDGHELLLGIADLDIPVTGPGQKNVVERARSMATFLEWATARTPPEIIERLFDPSRAALIEGDAEKQRWVAEDLASLRSAALELIERDPEAPLRRVVANLRYRIATRAPLVETEEPRVQIMTLHSAKGLQGDNIVLAGMADQMIPGLEKDEDLREEQRRLLYVAVTRAKSSLIVSWPRAVDYTDAKTNYVRIDAGQVRTSGGRKMVRLGRSTLLPKGLSGVLSGTAWLAQPDN